MSTSKPTQPAPPPAPLPPNNHDAERHVLCALLLDPSLAPTLSDLLHPADFYNPAHRTIYEHLLALSANGPPPDLVLLSSSLQAAGKLEAIGGDDALADLALAVPSAALALPHARLILDCSRRRCVIIAASNVARRAYDPTATPDEILEAAEIARIAAKPPDLPDATARAPDPWTILPLSAAFDPRAPLLYLVEDFMIAGSLGIIFGPPASKKSLAMADLAICLGAGIPWLPSPSPDIHTARSIPGPVPSFWLDFDNGPRLTAERLEALARGHNLGPHDSDVLWTSMPDPWLNLGDDAHLDALIRRIQSAAPDRPARRVVFIDNLPVTCGGVDENTSDMIPILVNCRRICTTTCAAVYLLAHPTKEDGTHPKSKRSKGSRLRGHSSILAALDFCFYVDGDSDPDLPPSPEITFSCAKSRYAPIPDFRAEFSYTHRPESRELLSALFFGAISLDAQADLALLAAVASLDINPAITEINQKTVFQQVTANNPDPPFRTTEKYLRSRLKSLVERHKLMTAPGLHGGIIYSIPPTVIHD